MVAAISPGVATRIRLCRRLLGVARVVDSTANAPRPGQPPACIATLLAANRRSLSTVYSWPGTADQGTSARRNYPFCFRLENSTSRAPGW